MELSTAAFSLSAVKGSHFISHYSFNTQLKLVTKLKNFKQPNLKQGSDTQVRTQKTVGFFGYTHLKNPPKKNPHFYFNLILVYTFYATNNAIFYCF